MPFMVNFSLLHPQKCQRTLAPPKNIKIKIFQNFISCISSSLQNHPLKKMPKNQRTLASLPVRVRRHNKMKVKNIMKNFRTTNRTIMGTPTARRQKRPHPPPIEVHCRSSSLQLAPYKNKTNNPQNAPPPRSITQHLTLIFDN